MSITQQHDGERETLSALFDGELNDDRARFALKRLDHDAQWRETCGRWQLAGDVLRGTATGAAPAGFAERVGAALASERTTVAPATATSAPPPKRRRWIGGAALAASVAVAALFVTRPFSPSGAPPLPAAQVATTGQPVEPATVAQASVPQAAAPLALTPQALIPQALTPQQPELPAETAVAMVAGGDVPRRATERLSPEQSQRVASQASQLQAAAAVAPHVIAANVDAAPAGIEPSSSHPFLPQGEIVSRPWPRAALPDYPAGSAFTASFDRNAGAATSLGASSFYPFEPGTLGTDRSHGAGQDTSEWPQR